MHKIYLNMVVRSASTGRDRYNDSDEDAPRTPEPEQTRRVAVNPATIRCFYDRKGERSGTRLTFIDGGGFAVTESYEEVDRLSSLH